MVGNIPEPINVSLSHFLVFSSLVLLLSGESLAETGASSVLPFKSEIPSHGRAEVFSAWNPGLSARLFAPGSKILFFGYAKGCTENLIGGPISARGIYGPSNVQKLTGMNASVKGGFWTPSADTPLCDPEQRTKQGDSFVYWQSDTRIGGVALFTATGPSPGGETSFFEPFNGRGQNGAGTNAFIEGTFVAYRYDWQSSAAVRPWARNDGILDLTTVHGVNVAVVARGESDDPHLAVQAKQQIAFTLINPACRKLLTDPKGAECQVQYLFNLAIYRAGIADWNMVPWAHDASVFFDPAQGGMTIIHAFLGTAGTEGKDRNSQLTLFASLAAPTQHDVFSSKEFHVRINRIQFINALRVAVAASLKKPINTVSESDMASIFGPHWEDARDWALLSVSVGQEVHNPFPNVRAQIGGTVRAIQIGTTTIN